MSDPAAVAQGGAAAKAKAEPLFPSLAADELSVTEVESLCMNCHKQGVTKLLLTRIPYFKDVVISSFECSACGYESRSTDLAGRVEDHGVEIELKVRSRRDFNRKVVRARGCEVRLPHLDSVFPCSESSVSTIEGVFSEIAGNLEATVEELEKSKSSESLDGLRQFIRTLKDLSQSESPDFAFVLYDPSGNSFLENPHAPKADPNLKLKRFTRSKQQNEALGIAVENAPDQPQDQPEEFDRYGEVVSFQVNCPSCNAPTESRMKMVQVPYFKEVVVMATNCEACGHKDSSVKSGGGIEPRGVKLDLHVLEQYDLSRDLLVSDTCSVRIPELDFETEEGSLGGKFTTVEGLLVSIGESLAETNPCLLGDAADTPKLAEFITKVGQLATGARRNFHLVLDDPAGNSYIQNVCAPDPDPQLSRVEYERSAEQNDTLGISHMRTENYAEDS